MINMTTDSTLLDKIKNRFEADSRCMLEIIKEHLLKDIKDDVLEQASALLEQSDVGDKQQEVILRATKNEIEEQTRQIQQELDRRVDQIDPTRIRPICNREYINRVSQSFQEEEWFNLEYGSVSMIASVTVSVFLPPALPLLSTGIVQR